MPSELPPLSQLSPPALGEVWLSLEYVAQAGKISTRAVQLRVARQLAGQHGSGGAWHLRPVAGRGGKSGLRHEVALHSLPAEWRARWLELHPDAGDGGAVVAAGVGGQVVALAGHPLEGLSLPRTVPPEELAAARALYNELRPIWLAAPRSPERTALIEAVAERRGVTIGYVRRLVAKAFYKGGGIELLLDGRGAPAGRRLAITETIDGLLKRAGIDDATIAAIGAELATDAAAYFRSNQHLSVHSIKHYMIGKVVPLLRRHLPDADLADAESLMRGFAGFVRRQRHHRAVAFKSGDAAYYNDNLAPKALRTRIGMHPMQCVALDCHNVDICILDADGNERWPLAVIWHDLATNRIFVSLFMLAKSTKLRAEHVIRSFIALAGDPNWGIPGGIYTDNGREFFWLDEFAAVLIAIKRDYGLYDRLSLKSWDDTALVRRARPYNAEAKYIETMIAKMIRDVCVAIPGYQGGNRMKHKSARKGAARVAFKGTFDQLVETFDLHLDAVYHRIKHQTGEFAGQSPNELFAGFVNDPRHPFRSVILRPNQVEVFFADERRVTVGRHGEIVIAKTRYITVPCDDRPENHLAVRFGQAAHVRIPKVPGDGTVYVFDEDRKFLCCVRPKTAFRHDDIEGARDQARRAGELKRGIRALAAQTRPVDLDASARAVAAVLPPAPEARADVVVSINPEFERAAAERAALPPPDAPSRLPSTDFAYLEYLKKSKL